jgi:hypothetical protein
MKIALDETGQNIQAEAEAPKIAICPYCGGQVSLRRRRSGYRPENFSYFWRHRDQANRDCPGRIQSFIHKRLIQTSDHLEITN